MVNEPFFLLRDIGILERNDKEKSGREMPGRFFIIDS